MEFMNVLNDGVVIVDGSFRPIALDRGAEAILGGLSENGKGEAGVTQQILNLLQSRSAQDSDGRPMYVTAGGHHYNCRVFVVRPRDGADPMLTLYLRREISLVDAVRQLAAEHGLTEREEEALIGLSQGLSSKEVAFQMKISPNTVKAFVRLAMIKMGARSRASVFAKVFDRQSG